MHFASLRRSPWTPSSFWTPSTPSRLSGQMFEWTYGYYDDRSGSEKLTQLVLWQLEILDELADDVARLVAPQVEEDVVAEHALAPGADDENGYA